jgi:hypothetical protein
LDKKDIFVGKLNNFRRDYKCVGCHKELILSSILSLNFQNIMLLWSPYLCSLAFHDFDKPKVYTLETPSIFYHESDKPLVLCESCFSKENWIPSPGPITCQFCKKTYSRAVNMYDYMPKNFALNCNVHMQMDEEDGDVILDGFIDPEYYEWIKQPSDYDVMKPFCLGCLHQFIEDSIVKRDD